MPQERLEPGAPPKTRPEPVQGPDGIWRLDRIRHRRLNGTYTRTSAQGYTSKECLTEWDRAFERKIREGTVVRRIPRHVFKLSDPMSIAFEKFFEAEEKRVKSGKIVQKTYDLYRIATYKATGPRSNPCAIRLNEEMGNLSIGEAGRPVYLDEYLEDVASIVPGIAAHQYCVLKGTFKMLTKAGIFDVSPMALISRPEGGEPNQRALFPEEVVLLYKQICATIVRALWFRILYLLILGTGIRPGEAFALWWSDCPDLDDDTIEKAVLHVGATGVKPAHGGPSFRQGKRKNRRAGEGYYITLPVWLTTVLRDYKRLCGPTAEATPILLSMRGTMVQLCSAESNLKRAKEGTLEWVTWGNLRDTVATHVAGRSGDPRRASAQLGHSQGATVVTGRYIDPRGYVHAVADNSEYLEELNPLKVGATLESAGVH